MEELFASAIQTLVVCHHNKIPNDMSIDLAFCREFQTLGDYRQEFRQGEEHTLELLVLGLGDIEGSFKLVIVKSEDSEFSLIDSRFEIIKSSSFDLTVIIETKVLLPTVNSDLINLSNQFVTILPFQYLSKLI